MIQLVVSFARVSTINIINLSENSFFEGAFLTYNLVNFLLLRDVASETSRLCRWLRS